MHYAKEKFLCTDAIISWVSQHAGLWTFWMRTKSFVPAAKQSPN
jgi:hypothetical protein